VHDSSRLRSSRSFAKILTEWGSNIAPRMHSAPYHRLAELRRAIEPTLDSRLEALGRPQHAVSSADPVRSSPIRSRPTLASAATRHSPTCSTWRPWPCPEPFGPTDCPPARNVHRPVGVATRRSSPSARRVPRDDGRFARGDRAGRCRLWKRWPHDKTKTPQPIAVVGAHLSGEPLNHQLTERGGRLLRTTRTAPRYRLYALPGTQPPKPGLVRVERQSGARIELEVWTLPGQAVGSFLAGVHSPLAIGTIELEDESRVHGFLCEGHALAGAEDISSFGGWRAFQARGSGSQSAPPRAP
jgi:hypothetical protein